MPRARLAFPTRQQSAGGRLRGRGCTAQRFPRRDVDEAHQHHAVCTRDGARGVDRGARFAAMDNGHEDLFKEPIFQGSFHTTFQV